MAEIGDIVEGRFACSPERVTRARITHLYTEGKRQGFLGEWVNEDGAAIRDDPRYGWGVWGYLGEVRRVIGAEGGRR